MSRFPVKDAPSGWCLAANWPPPPIAAYEQAVLQVTLIDEITGAAPIVLPSASTTTRGLQARCAANGVCGLVGVPLSVFQATDIAAAALQLSLAGPGYLPVSLTASFGAEPLYPNAFAQAQLGTVSLHRLPVPVTACVVSSAGQTLSGATVSLDGVWFTLADAQTAPPVPPDLVALGSPLQANRAVGATVAPCTFTPAATPKMLASPGNIGDPSVRLSDRIGLAAGQVLAIDADDPGRAEYFSVGAITEAGVTASGAATAVFPVPLTLARAHAQGAIVTLMTTGAAGPALALTRAASAGDMTLCTNAVTGLSGSAEPVIVSGGAAAEYHMGSLYAATSGANGIAQLPAVHRVAQLRLRVHAPPTQPTDLLADLALPFAADRIYQELAFS